MPSTNFTRPSTRTLIIAVVAIVIVALFASRFFRSSPSTVSESAQGEDVQSLVNQVARHTVVKQGELPAVAIVADVPFLQSQNPIFYKDVQQGDRLLVWSDRAILYSPSRDLILAMVSAPAAPPTSAPTSAPTTQESATIEVRNGSGEVGLGRAMANKLQADGLKVLTPSDARGTYPSTLIVIKSGDQLPKALQDLGAKVMSLPDGEIALKGDFLVIVGADFKK
ncbi:MAG: LytR C-terminal domain-containing protein [Candidatus Uhrbacteria bacterium]|nr:LytR C-terminal domain-containing protein [Candidatus Uhrbacteria bacterium]